MSDSLKREVKNRTQYLKRVTDLEHRHAEALAWRELGYSRGGIAKKIGSTESTVANYLGRIAAQYGPASIETKPANKREGGLTAVTREEIEAYHDDTKEEWASDVLDHPDVAPGWAVAWATERWSG